MIKLSIIVPIYNVEQYVSKCIESLLDQDYKDYQILLINDGSTDSSEEICLKYAKKYKKRIKVYTKENGGLSSARNYGMEKAESEYVFFVDGDDYIKPNCLSKMMKKIADKDILVFNYLNVYNDHTELFNTFDKSIKDIKKRYLVGSPSACNKVFKLSLFKDNNITFPYKLYYEDLATIPALCYYAKKIAFDSNAYYCYLQREGSIMHQQKYNPKLEDIFKSLEIVESRMEDSFKNNYFEEIEYMYILHLLKNASLRFLDFNKKDMLQKINTIIKNRFSNWNNNEYYQKYDFKRKVLCKLIMLKQYKLVQFLRGEGEII